MKVLLKYFKPNGKYYSSGEYDTLKEYMFQIFEEVNTFHVNGILPGLIKGHSSFIVLVDVPDHPHNHPHLIGTYEGQFQ